MVARVVVASLLVFVACGRPEEPAPVIAGSPEPTRSALVAREPAGDAVLAALDPAIEPCDDFYQYACGGWLRSTPLPPGRARYIRGFDELADRSNEAVRDLFERAAEDPATPIDHKVGAFWAACMDEAGIEAAGMEPLAPLLARAAAVEDEASLWRVVGELQSSFGPGAAPLFTLFVEPDARRPEVYTAYALQGGLGLPSRDYYVANDDAHRRQLTSYERHVAEMLGLLGESAAEAATHAAAIVAFEGRLAALSRPLVELRDAEKTYHPLGVVGLQRLDPALPWPRFFAGLGDPKIGEHLVVMTPDFFAGLGEVVRATPAATLRAYLRWHILRSNAPGLGRAAVAADFAFSATLTGATTLPERWRRCVQLTYVFEPTELSTTGMMYGLGEMIGQAYARERVTGASKELARAMIGRIEAAFAGGLSALPWMDAETRTRALEKVATLRNEVGHPETWTDYAGLELSRTDHLKNVLAWRRFEHAREFGRIGGPVAAGEWWMPPAAVGAYYDPFKNEMVLPAGILQPPFFSVEFPMAMNFGGLGMAIGHELTHGFDDQGRKYDAHGALRDWWSAEAASRFTARAQCVADVYSTDDGPGGARLDGALMLGENIADFGGIKAAHVAYQNWREGRADRRPIEGLSEEQLFFVAYAQLWCAHETPELQRLHATVDVHSPPRLRVNVPLRNFPAFAEAWQCAPGTPMRADAVCEVW